MQYIIQGDLATLATQAEFVTGGALRARALMMKAQLMMIR